MLLKSLRFQRFLQIGVFKVPLFASNLHKNEATHLRQPIQKKITSPLIAIKTQPLFFPS